MSLCPTGCLGSNVKLESTKLNRSSDGPSLYGVANLGPETRHLHCVALNTPGAGSCRDLLITTLSSRRWMLVEIRGYVIVTRLPEIRKQLYGS